MSCPVGAENQAQLLEEEQVLLTTEPSLQPHYCLLLSQFPKWLEVQMHATTSTRAISC